MAFVGVVRAEFLRARNFEYVNAARALGVPNRTIMFRHLLPNAMVATLTFLPFILNGSITDADVARLPRLRPAARIGIAEETAAAGPAKPQRALARHFGVRVISLMLSLLIFIGEATRDAFDPRKTFR